MWDFLIVALYLAMVLGIGLISGIKVKDLKEYSVSKNSFPTFVMVAAIFATLVGGGSTMGISEKVFSTGCVFLLAALGFVVRDLITAFLIVPKFEKFSDCLTVGDIMGRYYGRTGKIAVGIAGALQCAIFLGMQVAAIGHLVNYFLNLPYEWGVLIGMGIVIFYSAFGGIRAVTITDVVQFSILIVAIPVTFSIGMDMVGGFYGIVQAVPKEKLTLTPESSDEIRFYSLLLVFIIPYMNPALVQRLLMGRNTQQIRTALITSALGRIPYYLMVGALGLVALILKPNLKPDLAFPFLVNHILPVGVKGLVISGVLAVIMSTADSFLHVSGLLLTHDVIKPIFQKQLTQKQELLIVRLVTVLIGCVSVLGAFHTTNMIELNILAYAFWTPGIAVPLVAAVMGVKADVKSFITSAICGIATFLIWKVFFYEQTHIDSLLPAIIASALSFFGMLFIRGRRDGLIGKKFVKRVRLGAQISIRRISFKCIGKSISFLIERLRLAVAWLIEHCEQKVEIFGAPHGLFVLFAVANFCFVPLIFSNTSGHSTPIFADYLRVLACIFSFILVMKDFWPKKYLKLFPVYWHFTLFFCLPYFAITMCLFTSCSIEWVIDLVLTTFILGVLVDWKTYISSIIFGGLLAGLSFAWFGDFRQFDSSVGNFPIMAYAMAVSLFAGGMFSRNKERFLIDKLVTFKALGGTIAHEMRTPLSSIHVTASGLKACLPALIEGYEKASSEGLITNKISQLAFDSVKNSPERLRYICASTLNTIDMLLFQLRDKDWTNHFSTCSIKKCVDIALSEYSFREMEYDLITVKELKDFRFYGNQYLVIHILYNLMRNSLTFIQSEKKGKIEIWTSESKSDFYLHFKDTAKGISKNDLPHVFEHGFSKRSGGSGVGLHYCKRMMLAMSGSISVSSIEGQYVEFILQFPKIES